MFQDRANRSNFQTTRSRACRDRSTTLCRRDYFDVALLVGNLNSHGIIPAFEK